RIVGVVGRYLGQTQVVSEMIAGVLLGPSLFGLMASDVQTWLFPQQMLIQVGSQTASITHPSMSILYAISQIGLVLYMFLIGLEFNASLLTGRLKSAGLVSAAGIVVPFALGGVVAMSIASRADFFRPDLPIWTVVLYVGASMSITAFPMLARIIFEKGIAGTRM